MAKGYIYIMINPCLKDMVKIGYATNVEERRKQLSTTALPYDYEIFATYETSGKLEDKKTQKPPVNFAKCNIPVGAELVYVDDPTVRVTVATERKVQYNNELTSLSAIVQNNKGIQAAAGPNYFTYNGEIVSEIAARTQCKAD